MDIQRDRYLNRLIKKKGNGLIKIITGIRRCGKSYLLFNIFVNHLLECGVKEDHIIRLALDEDINVRFRNPLLLGEYVRELIKDGEMYYVLLDEIQKVETIQNPYVANTGATIGFADTLLGLMKIKNVDLYVTGSNSKLLSTDILTEFKDRGDEVRVFPLTYAEFCSYKQDTGNKMWNEYYTYGGMPLAVTKESHEEKSQYLKGLFARTYISDILERYRITNDKEILEEILNIVSSSVGSLTNPNKLANAFKSLEKSNVSASKIAKYLDCFVDAFLLEKVVRYDVKGKKYINTPYKYYFVDVGLRNARLNFRQQEENHIMENVIYNELIVRGFDVDVGMVEYNYKNEIGNSARKQLEIDFVACKGSSRFYIQSALHVDEPEKRLQETASLIRIDDSFKKIVVIKDEIIPYYDENGIYYIGIQEFLIDETVMA